MLQYVPYWIWHIWLAGLAAVAVALRLGCGGKRDVT